jgi:hypothetical protein
MASVDDVLAGCAPVHVAGRFRTTGRDQLRQPADERDQDVAILQRLGLEGGGIVQLRARRGFNVSNRVAWNDAEFRLGSGKRHLDIEQRLQIELVSVGRHHTSKNTVSFSP